MKYGRNKSFTPWVALLSSPLFRFGGAPVNCVRAGILGRCTANGYLYDARSYPALGDERLSAKKRSKAEAKDGGVQAASKAPLDRPKKGRSSDLGRALRTVYDDTLRESVPDDFMDLLGKLN